MLTIIIIICSCIIIFFGIIFPISACMLSSKISRWDEKIENNITHKETPIKEESSKTKSKKWEDKSFEVKGFSIYIPGDESVGIFSQHYNLESNFWFEDEEHLNEFIESLRDTFDILDGQFPVYINTYEEIEEQEELFERINEIDDYGDLYDEE